MTPALTDILASTKKEFVWLEKYNASRADAPTLKPCKKRLSPYACHVKPYTAGRSTEVHHILKSAYPDLTIPLNANDHAKVNRDVLRTTPRGLEFTLITPWPNFTPCSTWRNWPESKPRSESVKLRMDYRQQWAD